MKHNLTHQQNTKDAVMVLAQRLLDMDYAQIPARERRVIERIANRTAVSRNINRERLKDLTFGERLADQVASFGGSWTFLIAFAIVIAVWVAVNSLLLARAFDPYPYILLNLFLSLIASVQAPVIMMSQNRQAVHDRLAAAQDYEVNLKAEIEIMALHEKLDEMRNTDLAALITQLSPRSTPGTQRRAKRDGGPA
jgi:uncharacterized membrane protein